MRPAASVRRHGTSCGSMCCRIHCRRYRPGDVAAGGRITGGSKSVFPRLGIQPPNPSWGAMLARAYQYMEIAPEQMYAPGLAILVVSLAFNALGNRCASCSIRP